MIYQLALKKLFNFCYVYMDVSVLGVCAHETVPFVGQKRGHKHLGVKMPGLCDTGALPWGEALECGDKAPSIASLHR